MIKHNSKTNPKEPVSPADIQKTLLEIVETWTLNEYPTYRGFKCANCQEFKNETWYHWVNSGDENGNYRLPIHMCNDKCHKAFENGTIEVNQSKRTKVDRNTFGNLYNFPDKTKQRFEEIVANWPENKNPEFKIYNCDDCGEDLEIDPEDGIRKGFHVWWKMPDNKTLTERHFQKECGHNLGVYTKEELEQKSS